MIARIPFTTLVSVPFDDQRLPDLKSAKALDPSPRTTIDLTWREIVRGAVLCGVPDWQARRRLGRIGKHEIWRRAFHMLSHLQVQRVGRANGVFRTAIYETEDGSEKTASSYLIGMAVALAVARERPGLKALVHYDSVHGASGTRPDLVDADNPDCVFVEVKGRYRAVARAAMEDAVAQLEGHALSAQTTSAHAIATGFVSGRLQVHRQVYESPKPWPPELLDGFLRQQPRLEPWEPLALAIWAAVADGQYGLLGRTETAEGSFLHLTNDVHGLTLGLAEGLLETVVENLRQRGLVGDVRWPSLDEVAYVSAEALRGASATDDVLVAWSPNDDLDEIGRHDG